MRSSEDLSVVRAVDKVDDVARGDTESDVSHGERTIRGVQVTRDGESAIKDGRVGISNGDVDGVGITRGELPVNGVGRVLYPKVAGIRTGDAECQRRGDKAKNSEGFCEHF